MKYFYYYILFSFCYTSYFASLKFILDGDNYIDSLYIGDNNCHLNNILNSTCSTSMISGEIINLTLDNKNGFLVFYSYLWVGEKYIVINFDCDCENIRRDENNNPKFDNLIFPYIEYHCVGKFKCTAFNYFYCETNNLIFFNSMESRSSITNIKNYFNNDIDFYIIPEEIPVNIKIYCNNKLIKKNEYYLSSCDFKFEGLKLGTYTFKFNGIDKGKHNYTKSQIPCIMTLIICYKNCKTCISQNDATITTQNLHHVLIIIFFLKIQQQVDVVLIIKLKLMDIILILKI